MRKSQFTESQIVSILKQGEAGIPIAEILRQHNISKATYFHWRSTYAGASVDELKRLMRVDTPFGIFGYPGLAIIFFLLAASGGVGLMLTMLLKDE